MSEGDGYIHDMLRKSGEAWRTRRDFSSCRIDPSMLDKPRRTISLASAFVSLVGVVAVAMVGLLTIISLPPPVGQTGGDSTPTTSATTASVGQTGAASTPSPSAVPATQPTGASATSACSAILDNIPDTVVKSGKPTLAAAYEVTGAQLAAYEETFFDQIMSEWSDHPTDVVDVCIFDGDFDTMTPGPSGHDTSATRVLVVISAGRPELWAITRNKPGIPTTNPATIVSGPTASPAP
jgi:hypothetical protein